MNIAQRQSERVLVALKRLRGTPGHSQYIADLKENKQNVFKQMLGLNEDAPTNSMGLSSTVHNTGAIDTTDLPLKRQHNKKRRLKDILPGVFNNEMIGSAMPDTSAPRVAISEPGEPRTRRRRKTKVIFNPPLKEGWGKKLAAGAGLGLAAAASTGAARWAIGNTGAKIVRNTALGGLALGGYITYKHAAARKARVAATANSTNTLKTNTQGPWGARPKTPTVPSVGTPLKPRAASVSRNRLPKSKSPAPHQSPEPWSGLKATAAQPTSAPPGAEAKPLKVGRVIKMRNQDRHPSMVQRNAAYAQKAAPKLPPNKATKPTIH